MCGISVEKKWQIWGLFSCSSFLPVNYVFSSLSSSSCCYYLHHNIFIWWWWSSEVIIIIFQLVLAMTNTFSYVMIQICQILVKSIFIVYFVKCSKIFLLFIFEIQGMVDNSCQVFQKYALPNSPPAPAFNLPKKTFTINIFSFEASKTFHW